MTRAVLEFRTFGAIELRRADGRVSERLHDRPKRLALLALLSARSPGEGVRRERLVSLLWPQSAPSDGRAALNTTLSRIRGDLGEEVFRRPGTEVVGLAPKQFRSDVCQFIEALESDEHRRALDLYRGRFLEGFGLSGNRRFEEWLEERRARYRRQTYQAALAAGDAARDAGGLEEAAEAYRRALDLDPVREEAAERLVRTLADLGRPSEAIRIAGQVQSRRKEELGLAPTPDLRALVGELRDRKSPPTDDATARSDQTLATDDSGGSKAEPPVSRDGSSDRSDGEERWLPFRVPRFRGRTLLGLVLVAAAATAMVSWLVAGRGSGTSISERSVAVLPFETIGDSTQASFGRGLHASLLTHLQQVSELSVIARPSVLDFTESDTELDQIANELNARWIVTGSVQEVGDQVRIQPRLLDPRTGTEQWSANYRRDLSAEPVFSLQEEITRRIADALEAELTASEAQRVEEQPTDDLRAYRLYVQGRRKLAEGPRLSPETSHRVEEAVLDFRRAIERDSSFALAWSGLSDALSAYRHLADLYTSVTVDSTVVPETDPTGAARRALDLNPDLAEAHASMGRLHLRQIEGPQAHERLRRAVDLKPSYWEAHHWLGELYLKIGRARRARDHLALATELNPRRARARHYLYDAYLATGEYEKSLEEARLQRRMELEGLGATGGEVRALYHLGRYGDARRTAIESLSTLERDDRYERFWMAWFNAYLGVIRVAEGDTAGARRHLEYLRSNATNPTQIGLVQTALGNVDDAFEAFGRLREEHWGGIAASHHLRYGTLLDLSRLEEDPRYRELIRGANRAWGLNPDGSLPEE